MRNEIPDHPDIANALLTGYPDGKDEEPPHCPLCDGKCETVYREKRSGEIVGCDLCIEGIEPWEL